MFKWSLSTTQNGCCMSKWERCNYFMSQTWVQSFTSIDYMKNINLYLLNLPIHDHNHSRRTIATLCSSKTMKSCLKRMVTIKSISKTFHSLNFPAITGINQSLALRKEKVQFISLDYLSSYLYGNICEVQVNNTKWEIIWFHSMLFIPSELYTG